MPEAVHDPFATGTVVEADGMRAIPVGPPLPPPDGIGFADGIQRWVVDGHFHLTPVVRAYVDAAVLVRQGGELTKSVRQGEEFLVIPAGRLPRTHEQLLRETGLPVHAAPGCERPHPYLDLTAAARVVERRRESVERQVAERFLQASQDAWLVVDGGLGELASRSDAGRVIGLVKSHETQFLDGTDLETALTLSEGQRSSVFERSRDGREAVYSWYLRLWAWPQQDLLFGLVRVERVARPVVIAEATRVSRWLYAERAPIAAPDARWDRLVYPIHQVEGYLKAHAGGWS